MVTGRGEMMKLTTIRIVGINMMVSLLFGDFRSRLSNQRMKNDLYRDPDPDPVRVQGMMIEARAVNHIRRVVPVVVVVTTAALVAQVVKIVGVNVAINHEGGLNEEDEMMGGTEGSGLGKDDEVFHHHHPLPVEVPVVVTAVVTATRLDLLPEA